MKTFFFISLLLSLTGVIWSCNKETNSTIANSNLLSEFDRDSAGHTLEYTFFNYSSLGKLISIVDSDSNSGYLIKTKIGYDLNDLPLGFTTNSGADSFSFVEDNKGRIIKKIQMDNRPYALRYDFAYNEDNRLIADSIFDQNGNFLECISFNYNSNGDVVKWQYLDVLFNNTEDSNSITANYETSGSVFNSIAPLYFMIDNNNPLLLSKHNPSQEVDSYGEAQNYTYQYNEHGLPSSLKITYGNTTDTTEYQFFYK